MGKVVVVLLVVLLVASLAILPVPAKAEAKTVTVPDDYATIQEAIIHADPGDTVYVKAGEYNGSLTIKKSIALIGQKGATLNRWDIDVQPAILITANNVTVRGLTIDNPSASPPWKMKRGIHLLGATNCLIQNNTVTHCDFEGIWLYQSTNNTIDGNTVYSINNGISVGASSNNIITNNKLRRNNEGISLYHNTYNNTVRGNYLYDNDRGIHISGGYGNVVSENNVIGSDLGLRISENAYDNLFLHNNLDNTKNVDSSLAAVNSTNFFDNGKEGNYYSDYIGVDVDGNGVGDMPYTIIAQGLDLVDRYPLMQRWTGTGLPPVISILSPAENATFTTAEVQLNFTLSRAAPEIKYSLDGQANITLTQNQTLTELSNGNHNLTLYATDSTGNRAQPKTINFTIAKQTIQPDAIVLIAIIPVLAIVIIGIAVLLLRRRGVVQKP